MNIASEWRRLLREGDAGAKQFAGGVGGTDQQW